MDVRLVADRNKHLDVHRPHSEEPARELVTYFYRLGQMLLERAFVYGCKASERGGHEMWNRSQMVRETGTL